jgi:hypothetical protein
MKSFREVVLPEGMLDEAIRISGYSHDASNETKVKEFLQKVLYFKQLSNIYHRNVSTDDSIDSITNKVRSAPKETYFLNKKGYKVVQNTGYSRSLSDIYRICKSYHPDVKLHVVMERMLDANGFLYCSVVRKLVFHMISTWQKPSHMWGRKSMIDSSTEFSRAFRSRLQYLIIKKLNL